MPRLPHIITSAALACTLGLAATPVHASKESDQAAMYTVPRSPPATATVIAK